MTETVQFRRLVTHLESTLAYAGRVGDRDLRDLSEACYDDLADLCRGVR